METPPPDNRKWMKRGKKETSKFSQCGGVMKRGSSNFTGRGEMKEEKKLKNNVPNTRAELLDDASSRGCL